MVMPITLKMIELQALGLLEAGFEVSYTREFEAEGVFTSRSPIYHLRKVTAFDADGGSGIKEERYTRVSYTAAQYLIGN